MALLPLEEGKHPAWAQKKKPPPPLSFRPTDALHEDPAAQLAPHSPIPSVVTSNGNEVNIGRERGVTTGDGTGEDHREHVLSELHLRGDRRRRLPQVVHAAIVLAGSGARPTSALLAA